VCSWGQCSIAERAGITTRTYTPGYPARWSPSAPVPVVFAPPRVVFTSRDREESQPAADGDDARLAARSGQLGPILVVDDDPAILATVADILALFDYPVVTAADGAEALRLATELRPALVLLDLRMPGIDGWDVARTLRARGLAAPILVMTAAQDARRWAEQLGADGYLAKPFDLNDLLTAVERFWPA
jgi:CheY-like chemotaxis protein